MNKEEIQSKLEAIAYNRTSAFCYNDYIECPTGTCPKCGSDDLARQLDGVGVEFGISWVVEEILRSELEAANLDEAFEESFRECYPENTQVAWANFDTVTILKELDPIAWECAQGEYESQEESEENIISFDNGSTYYKAYELEEWIQENSD